MRTLALVFIALLALPDLAQGQQGRTLLVVAAHADDEGPVGPMLARYAREGVRVHLLIVTDGAQGSVNAGVPPGPELAQLRVREAECAAEALGLQPPIFLEFPDGRLGDFVGDPTLLYRVTARLAQELERLRPDAIVTWGPDGGMGHSDHRIVSNLVTQLTRAGAPGATRRLYYIYIPAEGFRALYPERGVPPLLLPEPSYLTVRVSFEPQDLAAARRATACHRTQFTGDMMERMLAAMEREMNGVVTLSSAFDVTQRRDLFER
jgi:LmbE family N-acetylglucosaminyl deacetylase